MGLIRLIVFSLVASSSLGQITVDGNVVFDEAVGYRLVWYATGTFDVNSSDGGYSARYGFRPGGTVEVPSALGYVWTPTNQNAPELAQDSAQWDGRANMTFGPLYVSISYNNNTSEFLVNANSGVDRALPEEVTSCLACAGDVDLAADMSMTIYSRPSCHIDAYTDDPAPIKGSDFVAQGLIELSAEPIAYLEPVPLSELSFSTATQGPTSSDDGLSTLEQNMLMKALFRDFSSIETQGKSYLELLWEEFEDTKPYIVSLESQAIEATNYLDEINTSLTEFFEFFQGGEKSESTEFMNVDSTLEDDLATRAGFFEQETEFASVDESILPAPYNPLSTSTPPTWDITVSPPDWGGTFYDMPDIALSLDFAVIQPFVAALHILQVGLVSFWAVMRLWQEFRKY